MVIFSEIEAAAAAHAVCPTCHQLGAAAGIDPSAAAKAVHELEELGMISVRRDKRTLPPTVKIARSGQCTAVATHPAKIAGESGRRRHRATKSGTGNLADPFSSLPPDAFG